MKLKVLTTFLILSILTATLPAHSQTIITGYSDLFVIGIPTETHPIATGYSDLFAIGIPTETHPVATGISDYFTFGTKPNQPPIFGYSNLFLFNTVNFQEGIVAYYPFNGNANDESGNGNDGLVSGASLTFDRLCNPYSAYKFDGGDDYIRISRSIQDDFTICGWIKTATSPNGSQFWEGNGVFYADVPGIADDFGASVINGKFAFGTGNPDITIQSTTTVTTGRWVFVAAQRIKETGEIKIFINGVEENSINTVNTNSLTAPDSIYIGANINDNYFFQGKIDDIHIYNYALSDTQILALYNEEGIAYTSLNGTITNNDTGDSIENAVIFLTGDCDNSYFALSDDQGFYELNDIEAGTYNIDVTKTGYISDNRYVDLSSQSTYTEDFSLVPSNASSLEITDGFLTAYADNINEIEQNYYQLSGNVNINGILYFDGNIFIDKRNNLNSPELTGNCQIYAHDILGSDEYIKSTYASFKYYANTNTLTPNNFDFMINASYTIGGFSAKIGQLIIDEQGNDVEVKSVANIGFPINKVLDELRKKCTNIPLFINKASSSTIFSKTNGVQIACGISGLECNFIAFELKDVSLYYNTNENIFGGGFKLKIPGIEVGKWGNADSTLFNKNGTDSLMVVIKDENGAVIKETDFEDFIKMQKALGLSFLEVGMEIEFISGAINKLIVSISSRIPLGPTGLFITKMEGGVDDLTDKDNLRIIANVDIETGLMKIPVIGSAIKLDSFGVNIHPWSVFQGSGAFQIFGSTVSNGVIEYNAQKKALIGESDLNLAGILVGHNNFSLQYGKFSGSGIGTIKVPEIKKYIFRRLSGKKLKSNKYCIDNEHLYYETSTLGLTTAIELTLDTLIPFLHFSIGTNFFPMLKIWKGFKDNKQNITFQVIENTGQLVIVAGDTLNHQVFDFTAIDPLGNVFDKNNTTYESFPEYDQTVMIIDNPTDGDWDFQTTYTGDVVLESKGINQSPVTMLDEPMTKKSKSNQISLDFTDYSDTLNVIVFYDTDKKHFDGAVIDTFEVVNNATVDFLWQNEDIPNGEYYIYCRIDDGYNTPVLQYAPGSIMVENDLNIETPQNVTAVQQADSVVVQWDEPVYDNTVAATVYYKNVSNGFTDEVSIADTNFIALKELENGMEYEIWCKFINDNGTFSHKSNVVNLIFSSGTKNNPPYFKIPEDSIWVFIENETATYDLIANDADGNNLTFYLPEDTLGMQISGDKLTWTPTYDDRGFYNILLTVSDGTDVDSTLQQVIVYTQEQVSVDLAFSSLNLYEDDNMFVKLKNFKSPNFYETVTLTNINTSEQTTVQCRKVNDFDYIGKFELSYIKKSSIAVNNGDTIVASYTFNSDTYTAMAYYDSLPQPSDKTAPSDITDLTVDYEEGNSVKLKWTAPGDDTISGTAYKYDIRYSYSPIVTEDDYLIANLIEQFPYPSEAGKTDSLTIDLSQFPDIIYHDTVFFSIKAEDEMQNRGGISNNASIEFYLAPGNPQVEITDVYKINITWDHPAAGGKGATNLQSFRVYRKYNENAFVELTDTVTTLSYTDDLYTHPDGKFQYAVQAVFTTGASNMVYSDTIIMNRFTELRILSNLEDSLNNSGIAVTVTGLDNIYIQTYSDTTNPTGLLIWGNVFKTEYQVSITKEGYNQVIDTITLTDEQQEFSYTLYSLGTEFHLKVFFEGPFNGEIMDAGLNPINIPFMQPYNVEPWNYTGTESITSIPNNNIVDWVLVELRETTGDASSAMSDSIIARKAGFLLNTGQIVGRDGARPIQLKAEISDNLYVVIWHRNHLGIMSANPLTENNGVYSYDFTTSADKAYGTNSQKELAPGKWGMIAADGNADGMIDNLDKENIWAPQAGEHGYKSGDFNMNGEVTNQDKDDVFVPNEGKGSQVPD